VWSSRKRLKLGPVCLPVSPGPRSSPAKKLKPTGRGSQQQQSAPVSFILDGAAIGGETRGDTLRFLRVSSLYTVKCTHNA